MNHRPTSSSSEEIVIFPGAGPHYGGWYWYFKKHTSTTYGPFKTRSLAAKDIFYNGTIRLFNL